MLKGSKNFIEAPQNLYEVSWPINKSLNNIPAKMAPIAKTTKGTIIISGDSCILS